MFLLIIFKTLIKREIYFNIFFKKIKKINNLENKEKGKLYFGKNKTGWGTVSFAYKLKNDQLKDVNFYLFRISFDGKLSTSTWYNTLENPIK